MIRRKIIFASSEPINIGHDEEKEVYHKNIISNQKNEKRFDDVEENRRNFEEPEDDESFSEPEEDDDEIFEEPEEDDDESFEEAEENETLYSTINAPQRAPEMNHAPIVARIREIIRGNSFDNLVCIFNPNCDNVIERTRRSLAGRENCVVLETIDMDSVIADDIYQCTLAQIYQNISSRNLRSVDSYNMTYFYEKAGQIFQKRNVESDYYESPIIKMKKLYAFNRRPEIFEEAVNIFLRDLVGENAKLIVPVCYYFNQISIETLDLINKLKSNKIVFIIGTMLPSEIQMELIRGRMYLDTRNVFN